MRSFWIAAAVTGVSVCCFTLRGQSQVLPPSTPPSIARQNLAQPTQRMPAPSKRHSVTATKETEAGYVVLSQTVADNHQQLVVLDTNRHAMAVYHINLQTGEVALKSVRTIRWDLDMMGFNTDNPQPAEIRGMLEHRPR